MKSSFQQVRERGVSKVAVLGGRGSETLRHDVMHDVMHGAVRGLGDGWRSDLRNQDDRVVGAVRAFRRADLLSPGTQGQHTSSCKTPVMVC